MHNHVHAHTIIGKRYIELHACVQLKTLMNVQSELLHLYNDVEEFCRCCTQCQKSSKKGVPKAPLVPLPVVSTPFQKIAMDIVGPLPQSRSGCCYILVICDYTTRYPEAIPLRNIDIEHIVEELIKVFARVGIPEEILTDQGSNFTSKLLSEFYRLLKVQAVRTSPYHPQCDGLVERFNQTLKMMLRKVVTKLKKVKIEISYCHMFFSLIENSHRLLQASHHFSSSMVTMSGVRWQF